MSTTYARCPRCGSTTLAIVEIHDEIGQTDFGQHEVIGRTVIPSSEFIFQPGEPTGVEMDCGRCGHHWRSRRVVGPPELTSSHVTLGRGQDEHHG